MLTEIAIANEIFYLHLMAVERDLTKEILMLFRKDFNGITIIDFQMDTFKAWIFGVIEIKKIH